MNKKKRQRYSAAFDAHDVIEIFQTDVSVRQAAARSRRVEQEIMVATLAKSWTERIYFHFPWAMGFKRITRPESRFASRRARMARGWSMVLVSERISRVVEALRTAGDWVQSFCSAEPKSVP